MFLCGGRCTEVGDAQLGWDNHDGASCASRVVLGIHFRTTVDLPPPPYMQNSRKLSNIGSAADSHPHSTDNNHGVP